MPATAAGKLMGLPVGGSPIERRNP